MLREGMKVIIKKDGHKYIGKIRTTLKGRVGVIWRMSEKMATVRACDKDGNMLGSSSHDFFCAKFRKSNLMECN